LRIVSPLFDFEQGIYGKAVALMPSSA